MNRLRLALRAPARLIVVAAVIGLAPGCSGDGDDTSGVAALSDDFDGAALDPSWTAFNDEAFEVTVSNGALAIRLLLPALWFHASQGTLLYKPVSGNFKVTATVHATKTSAPVEPPGYPIHLGGLMARSPASDEPDAGEDYVFIVVGYDENDLSVETKSTTADVSNYVGPAWPSAEAELRLCRVGERFFLYKRALGVGAWIEAAQYDRPDLPDTLQVGPNVYALTAPDLTVRFDEVRYAPAPDAAACTTD